MGTLDLSVLSNWYDAKAGIPAGGSGTSAGSGAGPSAPSPPWLTTSTSSSSTQPSTSSTSIPVKASALMNSLLAGGKLINPAATSVSGVGTDTTATGNYRNLFALYQGLTNLQSIAQAATAKSLSATQVQQLQKAFQAGLQQVQTYLGTQPFKGFQVYQTLPVATASTTLAIPKESDVYTTDPLYKGAPNGVVPAFQGSVQFSVTATRASGSQVTVDFNLDDLGSAPRTFANVLNYMNDKMQAAGLATRFGESFTAGQPSTVKAGSKTITLPAGPDQYSLKIAGTSAETLTFSAPASDPAVYVAQTAGVSTGAKADATQQLMKLDASQAPADPAAVNNQVFKQSLGSNVSKVVATAAAPDGSVYVLANVTGTVNGQSIQAAQDVALIKYDSAGNVVFTRTLGADTSASGAGLAVSADGSQVAITGSTADNLNPSSNKSTGSGLTSTTPAPQGFVSVYDAAGNEEWTQQTQAIGGNGNGVQPSSVAFGSSGMVYVAGQVDGRILGGSSSGGLDAYVQGFHAVSTPLNDGSGNSQWVVSPSSVVQYGTTGQDRATDIAVSGSAVYVSSMEDGDAVVRRFDATGSTGTGLTQSAVRDLGAVQGGSVAGLVVAPDGSVVVAGSTHNGGISAGAVTQSYSGGEEAFVAKLAGDLQPAAGDALTYLGGSGDQTATAITLSGGQVYIAGQIATAPMAGTGQTTGWDGYVTALDPSTGQSSWSQQYAGQENQLATAGITVVGGGASVLDQLGLPGTISWAPSQELVANTAMRPGDQLYIQTGARSPVAVTIAANDTYATLAQKIAKASNYSVKTTVLPLSSGSTLKLAPAYPNVQVSLLPGPAGHDALGPLGLPQGVLSADASKESSSAPGGDTGPLASRNYLKNGYSLKLSSSLSLANSARATTASAAISSAIATIKSIYHDMTTPPSTGNGVGSGKAPAYLTNQIAQYQAALSRLSGSSS
jgi:hypothetical protein